MKLLACYIQKNGFIQYKYLSGNSPVHPVNHGASSVVFTIKGLVPLSLFSQRFILTVKRSNKQPFAHSQSQPF